MRCVSGETAPVGRGRAPKRSGTSSANRWIAPLARGGVAAAIACAVAGTTIAAAGHVLALAVDAHSDARSLVGRAKQTGGLAWFAEPDTTMIPLRVKATPSLHAGALPADGSRFVLAAASGSIGDDDVVFTGSIGGNAASFSVVPTAKPVLLDDPDVVDEPLPLPRARPRLASLTPADINLKLEDPAPAAPAAKTAIYDITARVVYMPNGEKLEAHSGYGEYMDDPKYFKMRMRGVTPPNTYKLTMREALFHGHEAIRMNPENKEAMNGRAGILAHPYLLGPNGQSHGCVSFKDYSKFLAAFKRGEVDRMVVVFRMDKPPAFAAKRSFWPKLF
jgi:hypothetical protein